MVKNHAVDSNEGFNKISHKKMMIIKKEEVIMSKRKLSLGLILLALCISFTFLQGAVSEQVLENVFSFTVLGPNKETLAKGTGFLVAKQILVTNYHLISQAVNKVEGLNYKGKKVKFDGIISFDKNFNLALCKVNQKKLGLKLGNFGSLQAGKKVTVVGSNESGDIVEFNGEVKDIHEINSSLSVAELTISGPQTLSGAPVLDESGVVVGVLMVLEGGRKVALPVDGIGRLSQTSVVKKFKQWKAEKYFDTLEGSLLAGRIYEAVGESGRAQIHLENAVKLNPNDVELLLQLAEIYSEQRNFESAISTYEKVLQQQPDRDDVYLKIGNVYLNMMKWNEAIASFQKAYELNQQNEKTYLYMGQAYEELRQFDKAAESYEKYVSFNPEDKAEVEKRIGLCKMEIEDFQGAAKAFAEALKKFTQDLDLHENYAQALLKAKMYDEAAQKYYELAQLNPERAEIYFNTVVRMYDEAKMPEKAVEAAQKMVEAKPQSDTAHYNLGYLYVRLKRFKEAVDVFKKVIELRPDNDYAYYNLGYCYNQTKNYREAIKAFQKFAEINPDDPNGWFNIGINYMMLKNFGAALEPLRKTVELKQDFSVAWYNLAITYLNLNDRYSAIDILEKLKTLDPSLAQRLRDIISRY